MRAYRKENPGAKLKEAHEKWMESNERAAFMAGRKGVQL